MTDVACGSSFSLARECTPEEGVRLLAGFAPLEQALRRMLDHYPESDALQW
jgi:hypothetical protein